MTMLKVLIAVRDDSSGRSALPNIAQQVQETVPRIRLTTTWTLFGTALRPWLTSERAVRAFNIAMAVLLLASLYPVFTE